MSLADVVSRFSTANADGVPGGYTITRTTSQTYGSNGIANAPTTTTLVIDACVQPDRGRSIQPLPEGIHAEDVVGVDTRTPLQLVPSPDSFIYRGELYILFRIDGPRTMNGVSMFTGYAARQVLP